MASLSQELTYFIKSRSSLSCTLAGVYVNGSCIFGGRIRGSGGGMLSFVVPKREGTIRKHSTCTQVLDGVAEWRVLDLFRRDTVARCFHVTFLPGCKLAFFTSVCAADRLPPRG